MVVAKLNAGDLEKRARYLQSIACLVNDAKKHDEIQQEAQKLIGMARYREHIR